MSVDLEANFTTVANGWVKVERYKDDRQGFSQEDFLPDSRNDQEGQRLTFFGTPRPHSSQFLLYYAPNWNDNIHSTPVLLIHGTNDNADRAWANPSEIPFACGTMSCPDSGLMQFLSSSGYKVFAINFSHKHGDNLFWAEQIGNAISLIKEKTGSEKVDLIGWSKGAFAARMYISSLRPDWSEGFRGDVRKAVLIGCPNRGIDFGFRYGATFAPFIFPNYGNPIKINGPSPHTAILVGDKWVEYPEYSVYTTPAGNFFPGQKQMLKRWDSIYPIIETTPDWKTTYYGGRGTMSEGFGIDVAIEQGALVDKLIEHATPSSVQVYLLAGGAATIPFVLNEVSAPSDGLLFVDSATCAEGITNLAGVKVMEQFNHLQLGWEKEAVEQLQVWLDD